MALKQMTGVTVAVKADDDPTLLAAANQNRKGLLIQNLGEADIYIGMTDDVTAADGICVKAGGSFSHEGSGFALTSAIWGITATGTADVRVLELM